MEHYKKQRSRIEMMAQVKNLGEDKMMWHCQVAVLKTSTWRHSENLGRIWLSIQAHLQTNLFTIFGKFLDNFPSSFGILLAKFIKENSWKIIFHWIISYEPQLEKLITQEPIGIWTNPSNPRVPWFLGTFWNFYGIYGLERRRPITHSHRLHSTLLHLTQHAQPQSFLIRRTINTTAFCPEKGDNKDTKLGEQ